MVRVWVQFEGEPDERPISREEEPRKNVLLAGTTAS